MKDKNIDITVRDTSPIGSAKDVGEFVQRTMEKAFNEVLISIGKPDVKININIGKTVENIVSEFTQKSCEITAKSNSIDFAKHIIDNNLKDKNELENIYQEKYYGKNI